MRPLMGTALQIFSNFFFEYVGNQKRPLIFATRLKQERRFGSVVQLVRMPPCHGGGRGFESRPVRTCFVETRSQSGFSHFGSIFGSIKTHFYEELYYTLSHFIQLDKYHSKGTFKDWNWSKFNDLFVHKKGSESHCHHRLSLH